MSEICKLVGERITEIRKYNRINQSELAEKLGKSLRTVQKYESGEIDIPLSTLAEIATALNTSLNYLVGYDSSHIKLESLADVLAFFYELDKKKEIDFDIKLVKTDMDEWNCSLVFDGKNVKSEYNSCICLEMETLKENREALETYWMSPEAYYAWEKQSIDYHEKLMLTDKEYEVLDSMERIRKRNELDRIRYQEMLRKATENADDEQ